MDSNTTGRDAAFLATNRRIDELIQLVGDLKAQIGNMTTESYDLESKVKGLSEIVNGLKNRLNSHVTPTEFCPHTGQ